MNKRHELWGLHWTVGHPGTRGQTNTDNPAEYGYIRNRIVPIGMKRIAI